MKIPPCILYAISNACSHTDDEFDDFIQNIEQLKEEGEINTVENVIEYLQTHSYYAFKTIEYLQEQTEITRSTNKHFKQYIRDFCMNVFESLG